MSNTERDWVEEVGAPAYAAIVEMVAALDVDYDRLEELKRHGTTEEEGKELAELESNANGQENREDAQAAIEQDALSVEVRSDWHSPHNDAESASEFKILLSTGGPAVQIRGELSGHGEPDRAWLEVQDWGKPWTQYFKADQDTLLAYARCFYFGEG